MGLRGPKPKGKVKIKWSPNFAYAIGLIATDGCLSGDGRHILFTSKDKELAEKFQKALLIKLRIGKKARGGEVRKKYFVVQFSDVNFYNFLVQIGLTPRKSKTLGSVSVPERFFYDFLRGCFDGDGSFYSYWDPRWRSSFMFYTTFVSASPDHIFWLRKKLKQKAGILGHISADGRKITLQLKYAKRESLKILKKMYYSDTVVCLSRKRQKIEKAMRENNGG